MEDCLPGNYGENLMPKPIVKHPFQQGHTYSNKAIPPDGATPWSKDIQTITGRKGFIRLTLHAAVHHQRKSGLELKQVRELELMQRPWRDVLYWLASPGLLSLLSYRTQDYQPRDGTTHKGTSLLDH